MAKSTNFIRLDWDRVKIHAIQCAANDTNLVMSVQITHPDLPGKRWFGINSRDNGYFSRTSSGRNDVLHGECYAINGVDCRWNVKLMAAKAERPA
jgi:hypothetical protein